MAYLLDANTFIQAKNEYYGFDICPGYWDWLERENSTGNVFSIDRIGDELKQGNDQLAAWASARGRTFFLPLDNPRGSGDAPSKQLGARCGLSGSRQAGFS